jgi:hypothetical protein
MIRSRYQNESHAAVSQRSSRKARGLVSDCTLRFAKKGPPGPVAVHSAWPCTQGINSFA